MREFYLYNGNGNKYSLMDLKHWLYEPKNLGARFSSKYEQIGSDFVRTRRIPKPEDIKGSILFTGKNQYEQYSDFIKFLAVEPLTLEYVSDGTYRAKVDLVEVDKGEINQDSILECPISLKRISRWYKTITILNENTGEGGKIYDYSYDYHYTEFEPQQATVQSDSGYDSPIKLTIFGPAINPSWKHYLNNNVIAEGKITAEIRTGRRLVIDNTTIPYRITEQDNSGNVINDLYQDSDFSTQRFFNMQYGENRITVEHEGTNLLNIALEARLEYETV